MANNTKEFRVNEYLRSFEKSLNYMVGAIAAICVIGISRYVSGHSEWWTDLPETLSCIQENPREILCILTAVLSTLPYYFYYTLKDNINWNACSGPKDNCGLAKIYILYEIGVMGLFYLLLQGDTKFAGSKLIISLLGTILTIIYIAILLFRQKRNERIGYFIAVVVMAFFLFLALFFNNLKKLDNWQNQEYTVTIFMLLFLANATVNIFFLHRFDSCAETGIIANRIKIIIPVLSISVYTTAMMYCFCYHKNNLKMLVASALWITVYEIVISKIKCFDVRVKIMWCIASFMAFIIGLPILIWNFVSEANQKELILNWFLTIGICIYLVSTKYLGCIIKLLFQQKNAEESQEELMNTVIWFRNSILGSMLFILVILMQSQKHFLLLATLIPLALIVEFFVYRYVFNHSRRYNAKITYALGRVTELFAILLPLLALIIESVLQINWIQHLPDDKNVLFVVIAACVILSIMGLYLYIISKFDKGEWVKLPELGKKQVLKEVWNFLRSIKKLTDNILPDKNVENFWMAVLTWGMYIILTTVSLYVFPFNPSREPELIFKISGIIIMVAIIEVDWIFLSRNLLNFYMEKMREGEDVMKYKKTFIKEWEQCLKGFNNFRESDAKQFQMGSFYRPILFYFGATYQQNNDLNEETYRNIARASCSLELIHKSTVMIDDYLDGDEIRNAEESFHHQYPEEQTLILLRNSMLAKAQINFIKCRSAFLCNDDVMINNIQKLAQIIYASSLGHYRELSLADYDRLRSEEVKEINFMETVFLFKKSIGLGYSCFHEYQGTKAQQNLEKLGEEFGYFYQCMNDLDPFIHKERRERYKGTLNNFGRKNMVLLTLYNHLTEEEKSAFHNYKYHTILKLYQKYCIEQEILNNVNDSVNRIKDILDNLKAGNRKWIKDFKKMFNYILMDRRWQEKIPKL